MTDNSDLPYGHNTTKFRAAFVSDGDQTPGLGQALQDSVDYDPVKLHATFVAEGQPAPGHPFVKIGHGQFRPDPSPDPRPAFTRTDTTRPVWPTPPDDHVAEDGPPPPRPAAAFPERDPLSAGLSVWRAMGRPGSLRRRRTPPQPAAAGDVPGMNDDS